MPNPSQNMEVHRPEGANAVKEDDLRHLKAIHQSLIEALPQSVYQKDAAGHFTFANKKFLQTLGCSLEELLGKTDADFYPPKLAHKYQLDDKRVQETGEAFETIEEHLTSNGERIYVCVIKTPVFDADNRLIGTQGIFWDVTSRWTVQEALRDSERLFQSVWKNAADPMRLTNSEGIIVAVNGAFCKLVGQEPDALEGKPLTTIYAAEQDHAEILRQYREAFANRTIETQSSRELTLRSGKTVVLEISNSFIELHQKPSLLLSILRDITEQRQNEEQRSILDRKLVETQKLESLGVLAGGIAHDFNNLLTAVLGNASLALMHASSGSLLRPYLSNIEKTSLQAAGLCQQMLAYAGRGHFHVQLLDVNHLIDDMTHLFQISIHKNIELKLELGADLPQIKADSSQIRQVLMNLVINASEAIGNNNGTITLRSSLIFADRRYLAKTYLSPNLSEGHYLLVEVADSGCGMPQEIQSKIFEPFFTTKFTGRGLGLAAVLGIIRGHKGALKITSQPNRGATFSVLFPAVSASAPAACRNADPGSYRSGSGTILIADDEEAVRVVTSEMLESLGFKVITTADSVSTLDTVRRYGQQLVAVVLDMTMPPTERSNVFQEIRQFHQSLPILLISGYSECDAPPDFSSECQTDFLQKPFKPGDIKKKLQALLEPAQSLLSAA